MLMARLRDEWPAEKRDLMRDLIDAGVSAASICVILEDEFGGTCCEATLKQRAEDYGFRWPGQTAASRQNGAAQPWPDEKNRRLTELLADGMRMGEIVRVLRDEFGPTHSKSTVRQKARALGLAIPRPSRLVDKVARAAIQQDGDFLDLTIIQQDCEFLPKEQACQTLTTLSRSCQYPLGEPGTREFRFCGSPVPLGRPYCETHHRICYIFRFELENGHSVSQESEAASA
jgi:hypothetical protein